MQQPPFCCVQSDEEEDEEYDGSSQSNSTASGDEEEDTTDSEEEAQQEAPDFPTPDPATLSGPGAAPAGGRTSYLGLYFCFLSDSSWMEQVEHEDAWAGE